MTRDEFVTLMKQRCRREADMTLDARIVSEMQYVQEYILEGGVTLPWFLLSENLTVSTTIGEERVALPTNVDSIVGKDFLREHEEGSLWYYDTVSAGWVELYKDDYDALLAKYPSGTGTPVYYALDGEYFRLKPTPDAVLTLRIKCYLRALRLTTNIENSWLKWAGDLMMGEVGVRIAADHLRDTALAQSFASQINSARSRLFIIDEARKHANRDYEMGD